MVKKKKDEPDDRGPTSLFLFTPTSPVRRLMTWLVNWPPFEWIIILTIMANCVVMALDDKLSNNDKSIMSLQLVSRYDGTARDYIALVPFYVVLHDTLGMNAS